MALAGLSRAQVPVVNLDLAGAQFGTGVSINETSDPQKIQASTVYRFVLSGKVHGTGLLAQAVPNGTDINQLVTQLGGDPDMLQGTVNNAPGTLPFTFINQTFNQTVGSGLTAATVTLKMLGRIAADGVVTFSVTNVSIEAAGFPLTDKIVFEAGSKLFVGVPPRLQFAAATVEVSEAAASAVISVQRTENATGIVTVNYATASGSAIDGTDFTGSSGTLTFPANETNQDITIPLIANTAEDGDRSFTLSLTTPGGGALLGTQIVVTVNITDDDVPLDTPRIRFASASVVGGEDEPEVVVTIQRTGDTTAAASVNYATADESAIAPGDYTATNGTANFDAGAAETQISIPLVNNAVKNSARVFTVSLSAPSAGSVLGSLRTTRVSISDDEISSFLPFRGTYTGLITSDPFSYDTAGSARVVLQPTGFFTAQARYGGKVYNMAGKFDTGGRAEPSFTRTSSFTLFLRISARAPGVITGEVRDSGQKVADLTAKQSYYSAARPHPRPGRYTVLLDPPTPGPNDTPATLPLGHGYGAFVLVKTGSARFVGKLADGTPIVIAGFLAQDGAIPVHLLPYRTGLLHGELFFRPLLAASDLEGSLRWRKKNDRPKDRAYPAGFESVVTADGSLHIRPPLNERVLNLPTGTIEVGGGNIAPADWFTRNFGMNTRNFVTIVATNPPSTDKIRLVLNPATGTISGNFIPPGGKAPRRFVGVLLRKQNRAAGLFLGAPPKGTPVESGWVEVGP
jgi:hypothetical protein